MCSVECVPNNNLITAGCQDHRRCFSSTHSIPSYSPICHCTSAGISTTFSSVAMPIVPPRASTTCTRAGSARSISQVSTSSKSLFVNEAYMPIALSDRLKPPKHVLITILRVCMVFSLVVLVMCCIITYYCLAVKVWTIGFVRTGIAAGVAGHVHIQVDHHRDFIVIDHAL